MTAGEDFLRLYNKDFEADNPGEAAVLNEVCATIDEIEAMTARIAQDGLILSGSKQQPIPNPLITQVRAHRETLGRLLTRLDLQDESEGTRRARTAAQARWK